MKGEPGNPDVSKILEQKVEQPKKMGLPFNIPKLKVEGLGLTEIIEPAKPMEQPDKTTKVSIPKKPLGLAIPKLNV